MLAYNNGPCLNGLNGERSTVQAYEHMSMCVRKKLKKQAPYVASLPMRHLPGESKRASDLLARCVSVTMQGLYAFSLGPVVCLHDPAVPAI